MSKSCIFTSDPKDLQDSNGKLPVQGNCAETMHVGYDTNNKEYLMDTTLSARFEQAAKIAGLTVDEIKTYFVSPENTTDDDLVETSVRLTNIEDIEVEYNSKPGNPILPAKVKTALKLVIGAVSESIQTTTPSPQPEISMLEQLLKSSRPVQQWSDEEILKAYIESDREDLESELNKRAKGQRFIVLTGKEPEEIDIDATLKMLKRARKETIPSYIKTADNKVINIYRVEEYHLDNRARAESPLRPAVALFDDFCHVSNVNFSGITQEARVYIRLIHERYGDLSRSDENDMVFTARKEGYAGLVALYPELEQTYRAREIEGTLPSLRLVEKVASKYSSGKLDPFKASSSHRSY